MRFVVFEADGRAGLAVETANGELRGLMKGESGYPGDLMDLLRQGRESMAAAARVLAAGRSLDRERISFLPPLSAPGKIICVGLNYARHARETTGARSRTRPREAP